jgi:predicted esterase
MRLYHKGELQAAYDLVTEYGDFVDGNPAQIMNFRYCIANKLGKKELALKLMREAIVERGYWWGYEYLLGDDDLESLREDSEFNELSEICRNREVEAKKGGRPSLRIVKAKEPVGPGPMTLMALHGNGDNASLAEVYWLPCINQGFDLALPQSSQITSWDAFTWADLEIGLAELAKHADSVQGALDCNQSEMILAGFSGGARLALHSVLKGRVAPRGLILVAPWLPELDDWAEAIEIMVRGEIRCWIICGERDGDCLEGARKLSSMLKTAGSDVQLEIIPDLDHDFPVDFDDWLSRVLRKLNIGPSQ